MSPLTVPLQNPQTPQGLSEQDVQRIVSETISHLQQTNVSNEDSQDARQDDSHSGYRDPSRGRPRARRSRHERQAMSTLQEEPRVTEVETSSVEGEAQEDQSANTQTADWFLDYVKRFDEISTRGKGSKLPQKNVAMPTTASGSRETGNKEHREQKAVALAQPKVPLQLEDPVRLSNPIFPRTPARQEPPVAPNPPISYADVALAKKDAVLAQTPKVEASGSAMPKMPEQKCSRENPDVWPYDFYKMSKWRPGYTRKKHFPGVTCTNCKGSHPTSLCEKCRNLWEVWSYKVQKGECSNKDCPGNPKTHATEACGLGEWRDHPDNECPEELKEFERPWPQGGAMYPLPLYYLKAIGERPHPKLPKLPDRWDGGFHMGFWDLRKGLHYSVLRQTAITMNWEVPEYDPEKFLRDGGLGLVKGTLR
ncbi:uncharacterized protein Z520_09021 [Fonsecaea multimorphosa CBS 102226]|uniref:Uncharacterized protein n=1 Tax=Fonsecaea multimorphosa CBS 102226 TaxID=1442371 RepID=A0A0D2GZW2_9EURO|nr:uncharacterized protein Z520_09021 [Fonsecaea multimorphosa CBS 102226]KIX95105.1 hypothetical protein Z520_09021 [Fonsecaea multimorphosa CBS 102226]OAL20826.1 hypothetical protein AYO22_08454 [Fonsecaea multimorphosa]